MKISYFAVLMIAASAQAHSANGAPRPQLSAIVAEVDGAYDISFKNVSGNSIRVPRILVDDPQMSGYWFFVYDVKKKKSSYIWSTKFYRNDVVANGLPRETLEPGRSMEIRVTRDSLESNLIVVPDCYYLVVIYRKWMDGVLYYSDPSIPKLICSPKK